ncbi:phosphonoacetaldehyde hydrolase [Undibacterium crateris]|uniref:phosphonoacetaldehyde hydrolase n=1 Tax=Undibacterium crateris TaxID=2528175 RepID=UPI00138A0E2E|nr:phosphonoacetaldehyde hydrolase [Undibacterium crateris]NDI83988.1 phosphonoacetaldehyde hydrolase [Undibacterium crateris]
MTTQTPQAAISDVIDAAVQHPYRYQRRYSGPLQAVIFDWAGTLVDFGSFAPTQVLVDAFAAYGFQISLAEARVPMGMAKRDHIRAITRIPAVEQRWLAQFGSSATEAQIDHIYESFMPMQISQVAQYSAPIPGALETLQALRERQIKIGSCSGYPRQVMNTLLPHASQAGITVDCAVAADDLAAGARPGPWMALQNVIALGITDVAACVKVDDTVPGIAEGLNAGMWTVGLVLSGNEAGFSLAEFEAADASLKDKKRQYAGQLLAQAGAHYLIDSVAQLLPVLNDIQLRMQGGERP